MGYLSKALGGSGIGSRAIYFEQPAPSHNRYNDQVAAPETSSSQDGKVLSTIIRNEDVVIAVMGVTGSGKSTFINYLTEKEVPIGHELDSCTQELAEYRSSIFQGRNLVLIDTPGFDDTIRQDTDILRDIAAWLTSTYRRKIQLSGIVYLHRITDTRMTGAAMSNLRMFQKLCGQKGLANVVLATTFWSRITQEEGGEKERQLSSRADFWKNMIDQGSKVFRHDQEHDSALKIVQYIMDTSRPVTLDIQREMVEQGMKLDQTAAGKEVQAEIQKMQAEYDKKFRKLEDDMLQAVREKDEEWQQEINQQRLKMESAMCQNNAALNRLNADYGQLQAQHAQTKANYGMLESKVNQMMTENRKLVQQQQFSAKQQIYYDDYYRKEADRLRTERNDNARKMRLYKKERDKYKKHYKNCECDDCCYG